MNTNGNRASPIQWSQQVERLLGELTTMHIGVTAGRAKMTELAVQTAMCFLSLVRAVQQDCESVFVAASPSKVQVSRGSFPSAIDEGVGLNDQVDYCSQFVSRRRSTIRSISTRSVRSDRRHTSTASPLVPS
jgi:hypothetical protein